MVCVNKNLREYQDLLKSSGLPDFVLSAKVGYYLDKLGRFPYLDELENANSENAIRDFLSLRKNNTTTTLILLSLTNSSTISDAVLFLNNKYRDKEIEVLSIGDEVKLYITDRPKTNSDFGEDVTSKESTNSYLYFMLVLDKFLDLYGINIEYVTNSELSSDPKWENVIGVDTPKAFIYNGTIYVNLDMATIDSPIHEMFHILFGSMKFQNRALYDLLVSSAERFKSYEQIVSLYPNRTKSDINEEAFITELSKYLTGQINDISSLDLKTQYEIYYNITRTLDTILMGELSSKVVPEDELYLLNLKTLAKFLNSQSTESSYVGTLNDAALSRILANKKSELIKDGKLKEECI